MSQSVNVLKIEDAMRSEFPEDEMADTSFRDKVSIGPAGHFSSELLYDFRLWTRALLASVSWQCGMMQQV